VSYFPRAKRFGLFLISFVLFAGLFGASPARAIKGPNTTPNTDSLFSSEVVTNPESLGRVQRDAVKAARSHLVRNAFKWGINPVQYQPSVAIDGVAGMSVVRFVQSISGIKVANSLLAITVNKDGSLLSYTKSISDYSGTSHALISEAQATELMKSVLAQDYAIAPEQVIVSDIKLVIVDSALVGDVPSGQYLAWRASTSILNDATSISMTYLSQDGQQVLSTLPFVRGITADPLVCDLQIDVATPGYVPPAGVTVDVNNKRFVNIASGAQGMPLCGVSTFGLNAPNTEVGKQNIIRTWDYFSSVLGQDINEEKYLGNIAPVVNGDATPRISAFIDVCVTDGANVACPYGNAFWVPWISAECSSGACSGIFLGENFDHADDVIAHELAHGVTFSLAFSSAMADNSETAALSEAISDIFGEAMDQLSVAPGEAPDPAWTIGEDAQAGGYRKLQAPSVSKIGKNWTPGDSHDNSGPVNRLAYVLANGGKIGKVKIKALGSNANSVTKNDLCDAPGECVGTVRMSQLVFATTSILNANSNYFDFGKQMMNACSALVQNGTPGFKKATCKNVAAALKAQGFTKMKISGMTKLGKVAKSTDTVITANVSGTTGAPVVGQEMQLQIKRGSKWKTVGTALSDGTGVVGFVAVWTNSATYRIISKTNGGVFAATGKTAKVKVR
jgi:Zn-dependent metalloprotease